MTLNKTDRLILSNQYKILQCVDPAQKDDYALCQEVVESGYELDMEWLFENIYTPVSASICNEVRRIFRMFEDIAHGLSKLSANDPLHLSNNAVFRGFDGTYELEHYGYAQFTIYERKQFQRLADPARNNVDSGFPILDKYRKMLSRWEAIADKNALTRADLAAILA